MVAQLNEGLNQEIFTLVKEKHNLSPQEAGKLSHHIYETQKGEGVPVPLQENLLSVYEEYLASSNQNTMNVVATPTTRIPEAVVQAAKNVLDNQPDMSRLSNR